MKRSTIRTSAAAVGGMLLIGVTTAAIADEEQHGDDSDVEGSVEIEEVEEPGVLAMSVDGDAVSLEEEGSEATTREFTRSEEHTSELQSRGHLVFRPLLET